MAYNVCHAPLKLCEMPEIYTMEKFDFLKSITYSQII